MPPPRSPAHAREQDTESLSDHISEAIDQLHALEPIAAGWRTQNQTADLIDDINRIGRRLARCGRS
ncbi:hypothetical protein O4H52_07965 [Sphingomonadaceae bacterium G21617-S1]|nr:hypothetical protein [Sphingomonadaceae bacterium G21617-S1]